MMKRLFALLLSICLPALALAEVDANLLRQTENCTVFVAGDGVNTVIRPMDQPFIGEFQVEDGELIAYLDYIDMPNENAVFLRLTVSIMVQDMYAADTMTLTVGKTQYAFSVQPEISEYDTIYYEDYAVCLTEESLPILKDFIKLDGKAIAVELSGEGMEPICGDVVIPAENVKTIRDRYEEVGGMEQDFGAFEETWPVEISK